MESVAGATTTELCDASSSDLVNQLNDAAARISMLPLVLVLCLPVVTIPLAIWLNAKDKARRTVVAFYDVNDAAATSFQALVDSFPLLRSCTAQWRVVAAGSIDTPYQQKTHAGASSLLRRIRGIADFEGPPVLASNIAIPTLHSSGRTVYFLPDRILVRDKRRYADISYTDCKASAAPTTFIEDGGVPPDAKQVSTTWQYVNKSGGPDRRFKNNRQLRVMEYGELTLSTQSGFRFRWQTSRVEAATAVATSISAMGAIARHQEPGPVSPTLGTDLDTPAGQATSRDLPASITLGWSAFERMKLLLQDPNTDLRTAAPLLGWMDGPVLVPAHVLRLMGIIDQQAQVVEGGLCAVEVPNSAK
jgi:DNA polymerase-3 subunit epsilon